MKIIAKNYKEFEKNNKQITFFIKLTIFIIGLIIGIIFKVIESEAKNQRIFEINPQYLVNRSYTAADYIKTEEQKEAILRSTNVIYSDRNFPEIGAIVRGLGIGGASLNVVGLDAMADTSVDFLDQDDDRDFEDMNYIYRYKTTALTSYKREKTAQVIDSEVMINNILLATNVLISLKERLKIGSLIILAHDGTYFIANTNSLTMRSLYSASLDRNYDNKYNEYIVKKK